MLRFKVLQLLLLKTSLYLLLVLLSIPPQIFCIFCLMSKQLLLCPVVPPLHNLISVLSAPFLHGELSPIPPDCVPEGSLLLAIILLEVQGHHCLGALLKFSIAGCHVLCRVFVPHLTPETHSNMNKSRHLSMRKQIQFWMTTWTDHP